LGGKKRGISEKIEGFHLHAPKKALFYGQFWHGSGISQTGDGVAGPLSYQPVAM
jgi:hypothetical protein